MEEGGSLGGAAGGAGMTGQRKAGDEPHNYFGTDTQAHGGGGIMPTASGSRRSAEANFLSVEFGHGLGGSPGLHGRRSGGIQSEHRQPFQSLQSPPQLQQQQQQRRSFLETDESFLTLDEMYAQTQQMRSPSLQYLQAQGQCDNSPRGRARAAYERRREERQRQLQQQQQPVTEAASASTASARPAQVSGKKRNRGGRKRSAYAVSEYAGSGDAGEETMDQLRDRAARAMQEVALLRDQNSIQYNDQYEHEFDNGPEYETEAAPLVENVSPHSGRKEQAASADDDGAHDSSSSSCGRDAFDSSDSEESEQSEYRTDDEEDESEDSDDDNGVLLTPRANGTGTDAGRNRRGRPAQMGAVANADTISRTIRERARHHNIPRRGSSSNVATGSSRRLAQPPSADEMVVVVDSSEDEEQQLQQQQKRSRADASGTSRRRSRRRANSNRRAALPPANSDEVVVVDDSSEDEEQPQQPKRARLTVSGASQSSRRRRAFGGGRGGTSTSATTNSISASGNYSFGTFGSLPTMLEASKATEQEKLETAPMFGCGSNAPVFGSCTGSSGFAALVSHPAPTGAVAGSKTSLTGFSSSSNATSGGGRKIPSGSNRSTGRNAGCSFSFSSDGSSASFDSFSASGDYDGLLDFSEIDASLNDLVDFSEIDANLNETRATMGRIDDKLKELERLQRRLGFHM